MRLLLRLVLVSGLAWSAMAVAADKKPAKKAPEPVIKAAPVATRPVAAIAERAAIWHTWTDKDGRKVDAQFCGLSGDFITIQTKADLPRQPLPPPLPKPGDWTDI